MAKEAQIAAMVLRPMVRALIAAGVDHHALLASEGLTVEDLQSPDLRIAHGRMLRLLDACLDATGDPAFALRVGADIDLGDMGLMGQLVISARTVEDGIARAQRFGKLVHDAVEARIEQRDGLFYWYWSMRDVPMTTAAWESFAGSVISRIRMGAGLDWAPREVWFPYPAPAHTEAYERFFRCRVRFDMSNAGTVLDPAVLATTTTADVAISQLIERRAEAALASVSGAPACADQVRQVLADGLPHGAIGAEHVAHRLHTSRATLARRLSEEGTSLRAILDALRRELALAYVRDASLSLDELARRLAFADARSLRRAFVRWTGTTPMQMRAGEATGDASADTRTRENG